MGIIDVRAVLRAVPPSEKFCSLTALSALVESLRAEGRACQVNVAGQSTCGAPIYEVQFGRGRVKALIVGGPHAHEPIGGLTVFNLLSLLKQGHPALLQGDVEWHVVPCIDPDGTRLNEGWSGQPFTLERYMKNFYLQAYCDQVDTSFPIHYKKLHWDKPSPEARVLLQVMEKVRPDFYFTLHNTRTGGGFYHVSRDIGARYYEQIYQLLREQNVPLQKRPLWREVFAQYSEGVTELPTIKKHYDYLEKTVPAPEQAVGPGAGSWDYLAEIEPQALTFVAELGYARHPGDESEKELDESLRHFKLKIDAESKFLATLLLEEWDATREDLNPESPFYRAILGGGSVMPSREKLAEGGLPLSLYPTRDILFNPAYSKRMTEADMYDAAIVSGGFIFLRSSYQFVRLLKESKPTDEVRRAIARLDAAFDQALKTLGRRIDLDAFELINCGTLARVQLGSGLIALNSVLEGERQARAR